MVAKMMRWRPWPAARKLFRVKLVVRRATLGTATEVAGPAASAALTAEVRWKGPPRMVLRRSMKRNRTREEVINEENREVQWNEEFENLISLTPKENSFHPWEIAFAVFNGVNQGPKNKEYLIGTASLNIAVFAASSNQDVEINLPLGSATETPPSIHLTLSLEELRPAQGTSSETTQKCILPIPLSPTPGVPLSAEKDEAVSLKKDEPSAIKAGLMKVKLITDFVSTKKSKKTCRDDEGSDGGRCSAQSSEEAEYTYPFDSDCIDDEVEEVDAEDEKYSNSFRKSFSYGTLPSANLIGGSFCSDMKLNGEYEDWIYYSHRKSDVGCLQEETSSSLPEEAVQQSTKRSILPWKRKKLSFRSPKVKGEPLLKKSYGEEGGDDIDFDRRQLSSSDESNSLGRNKLNEGSANHSSISDFGDDNFAVGCWETKEVVSRDGHMKLSTKVFFASIDQRSERAAGESACTALVAVIADWFQKNPGIMPIKSQFDSLIRDGSLEWRNLCENETFRERFPDKHFDLDTVLQAKIRPFSVHPGKSFIGFFNPEGTEDVSGFEFLHGAMSFDSIWEEISKAGSECGADGIPHLYIVSWNDHFFLLKVEQDAYYIIDTLGERLYEGCDQAYILKFDATTSICRVPQEEQKSNTENVQQNNTKEDSKGGDLDCNDDDNDDSTKTEEVICKGKEACKEYIKNFLAAIPIRELQADIKKGLMNSTPLHHRLQIEFHYTESSSELILTPSFFPWTQANAEFSWPAEPASTAAFSLTPAINLQMEVA